MRLVSRERPLIGPSPCVWLWLVQSMSARGGTFQSAKSPKARAGERPARGALGRLEGVTMYEPSRQISSFYIAGFQYWDGALVLSELKVGERLRLVPEFDNPHDPSAMAIYRGKTKMGFVPGSETSSSPSCSSMAIPMALSCASCRFLPIKSHGSRCALACM